MVNFFWRVEPLLRVKLLLESDKVISADFNVRNIEQPHLDRISLVDSDVSRPLLGLSQLVIDMPVREFPTEVHQLHHPHPVFELRGIKQKLVMGVGFNGVADLLILDLPEALVGYAEFQTQLGLVVQNVV